jgi:glyoxylase-like metal-dependent hydrolase (beta-lactamase superfamily II)
MADASVTFVDRGRVEADRNFVVDGAVAATAADPNPDLAYDDFVVWNLVIDHPEATILWDTGPHPEAAGGYWPEPLAQAFAYVEGDEGGLPADLDAAGYGIDDVDCVVMSHLHLDHAGELRRFEGTDTPVYVHREELPFAYYSAKTGEGSIAYLASDFDRDVNWEIVHGDRVELYPGIELLHLPGHTPGLLGALIDVPEGTVLVAGDEAYVDANYRGGRPMATSLLWDNRAWAESRQRLMDIERRHDADVLLGHDLAMVERFGEGWG